MKKLTTEELRTLASLMMRYQNQQERERIRNAVAAFEDRREVARVKRGAVFYSEDVAVCPKCGKPWTREQMPDDAGQYNLCTIDDECPNCGAAVTITSILMYETASRAAPP